MALTVDQVFRDFNAPNVPGSGDHEPVKAEIRALLKQIQNSGGQSVTRGTIDQLNSVTPPNENYMGIVLSGAGSGYYYRQDNSWVFSRGFPDTVAVLNQSGGTGNVIQAAGFAGLSLSNVVLGILFPTATNEAGGVILSVNSGPSLPVLSAGGSTLAPGEISAGIATLIVLVDNSWRIIASSNQEYSFRGTWNSSSAYRVGDIVSYESAGNTNAWYAISDNLNQPPNSSPSWTLFVSSASSSAIPDGSVTPPKLSSEVSVSLAQASTSRAAPTRSVIKAADPLLVQAFILYEVGYEGAFALKTGSRPTLSDTVNYLASDTSGYYWERVDWKKNRPSDRFIASFFRSDLDTTIDIYSSLDGRKFSRIQPGAMRESYTDNVVDGRDPGLFYYRGQWFISITRYFNNSSEDKADCIIWVSDDLTSWRRMRMVIGGGIYSPSASTVGGTVPTDMLWAPKLFEHNGQLYVILSVRFSPNANDAGGNSIPVFRAVWARITTMDDGNFRMLSSDWSVLDIPYASNMIDYQIYQMGPSSWWCVYKNEFNKTIEIRRSTTSPFTGYGAIQAITFPVAVEGPCLVRRHLNDGNTTVLRLYADANYQGYEYYADSTDNGATWAVGSTKIIETQFATRHGTVLNLGDLPKDASSSWDEMKSFASFDRVAVPIRTVIISASASFIPEDDVLYVVQSATSATLTVSSRGARRFFIACQSGAAGAKIDIAANALVPRIISASVAASSNDQVIEIILSPGNSGQYYKA